MILEFMVNNETLVKVGVCIMFVCFFIAVMSWKGARNAH